MSFDGALLGRTFSARIVAFFAMVTASHALAPQTLAEDGTGGAGPVLAHAAPVQGAVGGTVSLIGNGISFGPVNTISQVTPGHSGLLTRDRPINGQTGSAVFAIGAPNANVDYGVVT